MPHQNALVSLLAPFMVMLVPFEATQFNKKRPGVAKRITRPLPSRKDPPGLYQVPSAINKRHQKHLIALHMLVAINRYRRTSHILHLCVSFLAEEKKDTSVDANRQP